MNENREGGLAKFEKVGDASVARFSPEVVPLPAMNLFASYRVLRV